VKATHNLDVERLERMASGLDKENASVDSVVNDIHTVDLVLGIEVGIVTLLNVVDNGTPGLVVIDKVTKAGGINNGQAETDTSLLNVGADGLDSDGLGNDVKAGSLALLGRVQGGVEEGIDKGGLAQTRFTYAPLNVAHGFI
jgi:hypothetical protein